MKNLKSAIGLGVLSWLNAPARLKNDLNSIFLSTYQSITNFKNLPKMKLLKYILPILVFTLLLNSCSKDDDDTIKPEHHSTFVLVHGAWQASFVWNKVKTSLEAQGNKVILVELAGHGNDQTPVSQVTFNGYVKQVTDVIEGLNTPVVLVGHSLGGAIVTQAATKLPQRIEKLIYVAGFIPKSGSSVFDYSAMDAGTLIPTALEFSADGSTVTIAKPETNLREIFCKDGSAEDNKLLVDNLRPEPVVAAGTPLNYSKDIYNAIANKYYIYTTQDKAISYDFQQQMVSEAKITNTYKIDAGHSPFLSKPNELVEIFNTIIKKY
ncbi:alpha/beta hydrolase [Chryseobacterium sp. T16E-39]|uniref:alpha/beta fold hydrolase n=1 Tax=Chryseobacterium sp. T16E-39 TaxID=2015076 RepID=UPI000B5B27A0|nr:alpha/beta fold hydrolase [Chryseobacterium sp. T16E-39]ASK28834.1 alpha/beta hydrolase [Chryseobacterium sp. T16E-39]